MRLTSEIKLFLNAWAAHSLKKMEDIFLVGQESSDEKLTSAHSQKNSLTNEDDNRFTLSEGQVECDSENLSSKVPLILDIKDLKSGRCLLHKSCPCTSQPIFANSSYLTSTSNCNAPLCIHSAKLSFDSFHILCRKSSLSSIPSRHTLYGYSPNFKQRVKSRSVCSLTDLIVECSPTVQTGNLLLHPSTGLLVGSVNETLKRKVLTKSAVDFQSVLQDGMRQIMTKTISVSDNKTTELISHKRHFCCSSSNSKSLCQSNSSNTALLQCVWESRYPFFLFSVGKDHGKNIYVASPHDTNSSIDKALDLIYLFHAHTEKIKESNHSVSNLVAKMKVRSFLLLGSGRPNCTETEFVLSAANEDLSNGLQTFTSGLVKNKELPCRLSEIFRLNRHSRSHSIQKINGFSSQLEELQELHTSKLGMIDEAGCRKVPFADFPRRLELAAIVVKTFRFARNDGASSSGGWGLKFLEKGEDNDSSDSQASLCSSGSKLHCIEHWKSDINVNVLIPAGIHGGPISEIAGPSSLIDRWMSNGQCDCGGWDVGCPLTVLNNNSEEDSKSLNLTMEGAKGEPVFEMCCLNKDLYNIYFQPSLSALQSFSIAVAIIHSQIPSLYPKW